MITDAEAMREAAAKHHDDEAARIRKLMENASGGHRNKLFDGVLEHEFSAQAIRSLPLPTPSPSSEPRSPSPALVGWEEAIEAAASVATHFRMELKLCSDSARLGVHHRIGHDTALLLIRRGAEEIEKLCALTPPVARPDALPSEEELRDLIRGRPVIEAARAVLKLIRNHAAGSGT